MPYRTPARPSAYRRARMSHRLLPAALLAALLGMIGGPARANLVTNGGFELGSLSGWGTSGTGIAIDTATPYSGSYDAAFTALSTDPNPGILSQSIATTPGQAYTLSFALLDQNLAAGAERFVVKFGGFSDTILGTSLTADTYTNLVLTIGASNVTSTSTALSFQGLQDSATASPIFNLDDVTLTANIAAVPEPSGIALLAGAVAMLAAGVSRRRAGG